LFYLFIYSFIHLFIYWAGVEPSPLLLRSLIGLLYQPWMMDGDDYEAIGGMHDWQAKPKYSDKPAPVPLCPPQIQ
jgi:hypothetical protein